MNPLILSLVCLLLVGVSANWLSIVKNNKTLIYLSLAPCIYIAIYGIYLVIGPVDLYEDGSKNFFMQNPYESELPPQFLLLKLYQYILIGVGCLYLYRLLKKKWNIQNSSKSSLYKILFKNFNDKNK